jgi:hypothetical protein
MTEAAGADALPLVVTIPLPDNLLLRRPDPGASELERALGDAYATARRDAIDRLDQWLPALPVTELADRPGGVGPTPFELGGDLAGRLDLVALADRLLAERDATFPAVAATDGVTPDEQPLPPPAVVVPIGRHDAPQATAGPVAALLATGSAVIVHAVHLHDDTVGDLTELLAVALAAPVRASLCISRGDAGVPGPRWDDHDTLILQGVGERRWELLEPTEAAPLHPVGQAAGTTVGWDGRLTAGHGLYIPRGWSHRVSGSEEPSMHLAVSVPRLRYDQLAGFVASLSGFWPLFRADVPFDRDRPVASYAGSVYDEPGRFATTVGQLADRAALEHGTAQWLAKLPRRRRGRLSTAIAAMRRTEWSDVVIQGSFPGGVVVLDEKSDPRLVAAALEPPADGDPDATVEPVPVAPRERPLVAADQRLIELEPWAMPALAKLADGRPVAVADLPIGDVAATTAAEARSRLASALVSDGLADVADVRDRAATVERDR